MPRGKSKKKADRLMALRMASVADHMTAAVNDYAADTGISVWCARLGMLVYLARQLDIDLANLPSLEIVRQVAAHKTEPVE